MNLYLLHAYTMNPHQPHVDPKTARSSSHRRLVLVAALAAAFASPASHADEGGDLETLRATTLGLIDALVDQGLLTRERANVLLKQAQSQGAAQAAARAAPGWGDAPAPGSKNTVRVPYLSETAKAQITEDIKLGVLATAREENWADARKLPAWLRTFQFEGDIRVRAQGELFGADNLDAEIYRSQVDSPAWSPDLTNTRTNRQRLTLRARFGFNAKVSDDVTAAMRLSTGTSPTSGSQTLGSDFNRYSFGLDRASLRWEPRQDLRFEGGRMATPFMGGDLLWPDDLSLDGVAVRGERDIASGLFAFATAGAFPLEEFALKRSDKWLYGAQVGADWAVNDLTQLKLGLGFYTFQGVEGVRESDPPPSGPRAGTVAYQLSQYPSGVRLRGNTLINLNDPTSTASPVWGLASKFRPVSLSAALTLSQLAPVVVNLSADYVKNTGFDLADIRRRAGTSTVDGLLDKTNGYQLRLQAGSKTLTERGNWSTFIAYRLFERDAWVDAFTDTTWNLGGTGYKGFSLGATYAIDRNTTVGARWTSTRNLDDGQRFLLIPGDPSSLSGNLSSAPMKIDVLQVEVNSRF
ncbi:putative porin [soil metagenome]